jgi:proline-specific peptidase
MSAIRPALVCLLLVVAGCPAAAPVASPGSDALTPGAHHVAIDGVEIAYEVRGQGPVCIAHPGGPGFDGAYLHDGALERHFTMVYLDPIGTGASGKLPASEAYSIARDVGVLDQVRRHLHAERVCLLGHSYGGFVVQTYAVKYPGRITALILYSTTPTTTDEWSKQVDANLVAFKDAPWFAQAMAGMNAESEAHSDADLKAALALEGPLFFTDWEARKSEYAAVFGAAKLSYEVATRREGAPFDVRNQLRAVVVPALVITGDRDFISGPVVSGWISSNVRGSKLVVIEHAGHFAHLEQPAAFAAAIDAFAPSVR